MNLKAITLIVLIVVGIHCNDPIGCDPSNTSPTKVNEFGLKSQHDDDTAWKQIGQTELFESQDTPPQFYSHITTVKGTTIRIKATNKDLETFTQQLVASNSITIVGSHKHVVLIKENDASGAFANYAIYSFDFSDLTQTALVRTVVPAKYDETWNVGTIIQIIGSTNTVYWTMDNVGNTYLVSISLATQAGADQLVASTSVLDITVGSASQLFDGTSHLVYSYGTSSFSPLAIGVDVGVHPLQESIQQHKMCSSVFAIQSRKNDESQFNLFVLWHKRGSAKSVLFDISLTGLSGDPTKLYTENRHNIVVSRTDKAIWFYMTSSGSSSTVEFSNGMDNADTAIALPEFYNAKEVSLQASDAFLLYTDKIMIYHFDTTAHVISKTTQIAVSTALSVALDADKSATILAKITCQCSTKRMVRFNCFSASFNCIATTSFEHADCSVDYSNTP